jgi:hypothetical protein
MVLVETVGQTLLPVAVGMPEASEQSKPAGQGRQVSEPDWTVKVPTGQA